MKLYQTPLNNLGRTRFNTFPTDFENDFKSFFDFHLPVGQHYNPVSKHQIFKTTEIPVQSSNSKNFRNRIQKELKRDWLDNKK